MEEKVKSLETEIALIRSDIKTLKTAEPQLPKWLKNSAITILAGMFMQIMTMVWWAGTMTANMENLKTEVAQNTEFRMTYPKMHQETLVALKELQITQEHTKAMMHEVKSKLRFVDLKSQVKEQK